MTEGNAKRGMLLTTTTDVPGRTIAETFGLVRGNSVRARHLGRDLWSALGNVAGGELRDYTKLLAEAREQALDRMMAEAETLGANAVLGIRFEACEIARGAAELLAYGTAVRLEP